MENISRHCTPEEIAELSFILPVVSIMADGGYAYAHDSYKNLNDKYDNPVFEVTENVSPVDSPILIARNKDLGVLEKMTDWMIEKPRAYTEEETRSKFLKHIWAMIEFWKNTPNEVDIAGSLHELFYEFDPKRVASAGHKR